METSELPKAVEVIKHHYKIYHETGIYFVGNEVFSGNVTTKKLLKAWGREEVIRVYEMIQNWYKENTGENKELM